MKKYLVIGNPIEHSLSPKLHNHWIKKNNIDAVYEKKQLNEDDIEDTIIKVRNGEIDGINVTIPFKKSIIPYLDKLTPLAKETHSVNTIYKGNQNGTDIVVGDKVHRHDGGINEVLKLQDDIQTGGRKLGAINRGNYFFTEDHPLKTTDGWKAINAKMASQKYHIGAIGELRVGDTIIGHNGNDTVIETIATKDVPQDT